VAGGGGAGSRTSMGGAYTEASIISTVGSGLSLPKRTASSSSTSTASRNSLSRVGVASLRSSRVVSRRPMGSRCIHSRSSCSVRYCGRLARMLWPPQR
jgi:hypothetical protein